MGGPTSEGFPLSLIFLTLVYWVVLSSLGERRWKGWQWWWWWLRCIGPLAIQFRFSCWPSYVILIFVTTSHR